MMSHQNSEKFSHGPSFDLLGIDEAPRHLNLFVNIGGSQDFDSIESCAVAQELALTKEDIMSEKPIELKFVKFQNVNSLTVSSNFHLFFAHPNVIFLNELKILP